VGTNQLGPIDVSGLMNKLLPPSLLHCSFETNAIRLVFFRLSTPIGNDKETASERNTPLNNHQLEELD